MSFEDWMRTQDDPSPQQQLAQKPSSADALMPQVRFADLQRTGISVVLACLAVWESPACSSSWHTSPALLPQVSFLSAAYWL